MRTVFRVLDLDLDKCFTVGYDWLVSEPKKRLGWLLISCTGKNIDKFTQILFHPTARDLLVGVINDYGQAHIRFWDLSKGEEVKVVDLPAPSVCLFLDALFM